MQYNSTKFAVLISPSCFKSGTVAAVLDGPIGVALDQSFQENANLKILGFGEIGVQEYHQQCQAHRYALRILKV